MSLPPFAVGAHGEIGLTQVRPELHGFALALLIDPRASLAAGAHILRYCIARAGGDAQRGLAFYNGAGPAARQYADRVLAEWARIVA